MSAPGEAMLAVAALERAMATRDYAGAARLVTKRTVLEGLSSLARHAYRPAAELAYRESVAAWRAEHEETLRRRQERDIRAIVAVLAQAISDERRRAA